MDAIYDIMCAEYNRYVMYALGQENITQEMLDEIIASAIIAFFTKNGAVLSVPSSISARVISNISCYMYELDKTPQEMQDSIKRLPFDQDKDSEWLDIEGMDPIYGV